MGPSMILVIIKKLKVPFYCKTGLLKKWENNKNECLKKQHQQTRPDLTSSGARNW